MRELPDFACFVFLLFTWLLMEHTDIALIDGFSSGWKEHDFFEKDWEDQLVFD